MNTAGYENSFKALQRINRFAADAGSQDELLSGMLDLVLDIFQCDRVWLLYPCDPDAPSWQVERACARPEWSTGLAIHADLPMTPEIAEIFRAISGSPRALKDDAIDELSSAAAQFSIKSQLIMAIRPRMDQPWVFGMHHCAQAHRYTDEETELFEEIGQRIAGALNHFAMTGKLRESERYNRMLFENSPIGLTLGRMDGSLIEVNQAFADIVGLGIEEAKELTAWHTSPGGSSLQEKRRLECLSTTARFGPVEEEFTHKDGHRVQVQISSNLLERDGALYILSSIEEIAARKRLEDEKLRESEERFRGTLEQAGVGIVHVTPDGMFQRVNEKFCAIVGYSPDELLCMNIRDVTFQPDLERDLAPMQQVLAGEIPHFSSEKRYVHKDKRLVWVNLTVSMLRSSLGSPKCFIGIVEDITPRILAETVAQHFGHLLQISFNEIYLFDAESLHFIQTSEGAKKNLGYSNEDLKRITPVEIKPEYTREIFEQLLAPLRNGTQRTRMFETVHRRRDGTTYPVEINLQLMQTVPPAFLAIAQDISERKRAEAALNKSERKYRTLIESSFDAIMTLTADDGFLSGNPAAVALFGCRDEQEFITLSPASVSPEYQPNGHRSEAAAPEMMRVAMEQGSHFFEWTHRRLNGTEFISDVMLTSMDIEGHKIIQATVRDITERKRAEQQLRDLSAHIQSVREQEKASLAREIHDDLGGTLTALKMDAYRLARDFQAQGAGAPQLERIASISDLLDNAVSITRRIITDLRPTMLDDLGLLAALEWQAAQFHTRSGIECRVVCVGEVCRGGGCEVCLDKTQSINLFRIFQETLTNVARHSGASRVDVEFEKGNKSVALSISDNGVGLPRGHTIASSSYGIRGMHERVAQLGGTIDIDTPPGGGFRLKVTVPVSADNREIA